MYMCYDKLSQYLYITLYVFSICILAVKISTTSLYNVILFHTIYKHKVHNYINPNV